MDTVNYLAAKDHLLKLANIVSPTGVEQRAFVKLLHDMELADEPRHAVLKAIAMAIIDGLAYGNWPKI